MPNFIFFNYKLKSFNKNLGILVSSFWMTYLTMLCSFCEETKDKDAVDTAINVNKERTYCEFFYDKVQELGLYYYNHPVEATLVVLGGCLFIGAAALVICSSNGGGSGGGAPVGGFQTNSASDVVENKIAETIAETVINYISPSDVSQKLAADTSEKIATSISEAVQTDPHYFADLPIIVCEELMNQLIAQNLAQYATELMMMLTGCCVYALGQTGITSWVVLKRGTSPSVNLYNFTNWYKNLTNGGFTPKKIILKPVEPVCLKLPFSNFYKNLLEMNNNPEFNFRIEYIQRFLGDLAFEGEGHKISLEADVIKKYTISGNYLEYNLQSPEIKSMVDSILSEKKYLFHFHNDIDIERNQVVATINILLELKMCFGNNLNLIPKDLLDLGNNIFGSEFFEHSYNPEKDYWNINQKKSL